MTALANPITQVNILYQTLSVSALKDAISGDVYPQNRPTGSKLEDVVINGLPVNGEQIQRGTANVNIYVPDLTVSIGGIQQAMPDLARIDELTTLATEVLAESNTQQYTFALENSTLVTEYETNQQFMNLRIGFQFFP